MNSPQVILCPGQGAQAVEMGRAWFDASPEARATFDQADRQLAGRLGPPLSTLCFEGPAERLNQTDASQPAIYVASIACWRALLARAGSDSVNAPLAATAGLSLGEYTALTVAGALDFEHGLELVTLRGRAMQDAADSPEARAGGGGAMLALIGATDEQAQTIADDARQTDVLVCANFNAPGQVVLSGHRNACDRAAKVAESLSIRSAALPVAGAFHSPLMSQAAARLAEGLAQTPLRAPRCPVISNVTAAAHQEQSGQSIADTIRLRLVEQLTSPVRWAQSCAFLAANFKHDFQELAPGKTLMGLMRRIDKTIKVNTNDAP
ncbi:MAG: ACP S-malonyltransferase [Phycisphaerales bacterium]